MAIYSRNGSGPDGFEEAIQGYRFRVRIQGMSGATASFRSVSGLGEEAEEVEYREGMDPNTVFKLPGLSTYPNVTLEKGRCADPTFSRWMSLVNGTEQGGAGREGRPIGVPVANRFYHDVDILVYNRAGAPRLGIRLHDAYPVSFSLADLDSTSSEVLIASLELSHHGMEFLPLAQSNIDSSSLSLPPLFGQ